MDSLTTEKTSKDTSKITDTIIIRQNNRYYIHFDATIVNNTKNPDKSIEGKLIIERKGDKEEWSVDRLSLSDLVKGQHTEINFEPDDLYNLHCRLCQLYESFPSSESGYFGKFVQYNGKEDSIVEFLKSNPIYPLFDPNHEYGRKCQSLAIVLSNPKITADYLDTLLSGTGTLNIGQMKSLISALSRQPDLVDFLKTLELEQISTLHNQIALAQMIQLTDTIEKHLDCNDEKKWQRFFHEHQWILEQLFVVPVCYFIKEFKSNPSGADGKGANFTDFGLFHELSGEFALVEIKTPRTDLVGKEEYRNNLYEIDKEVTNGVLQILNGRAGAIKRYGPEPDQPRKHPAFQPKCVLLIGRYDSLDNENKRRSFELYRNNVSGVQIITFDELVKRLKAIIKLLSGRRSLVNDSKNNES